MALQSAVSQTAAQYFDLMQSHHRHMKKNSGFEWSKTVSTSIWEQFTTDFFWITFVSMVSVHTLKFQTRKVEYCEMCCPVQARVLIFMRTCFITKPFQCFYIELYEKLYIKNTFSQNAFFWHCCSSYMEPEQFHVNVGITLVLKCSPKKCHNKTSNCHSNMFYLAQPIIGIWSSKINIEDTFTLNSLNLKTCITLFPHIQVSNLPSKFETDISAFTFLPYSRAASH